MTLPNEQLQEDIAAYIDGFADDAQKARVNQLMSRDADLATLVREMLADSRLLKNLPAPKAPIDLHERVMEQLERGSLLSDDATAPDAGPTRWWLARGSMAAAAIILVFAFAYMVMHETMPGHRYGGGKLVSVAPPMAPINRSTLPAVAGAPQRPAIAMAKPGVAATKHFPAIADLQRRRLFNEQRADQRTAPGKTGSFAGRNGQTQNSLAMEAGRNRPAAMNMLRRPATRIRDCRIVLLARRGRDVRRLALLLNAYAAANSARDQPMRTPSDVTGAAPANAALRPTTGLTAVAPAKSQTPAGAPGTLGSNNMAVASQSRSTNEAQRKVAGNGVGGGRTATPQAVHSAIRGANESAPAKSGLAPRPVAPRAHADAFGSQRKSRELSAMLTRAQILRLTRAYRIESIKGITLADANNGVKRKLAVTPAGQNGIAEVRKGSRLRKKTGVGRAAPAASLVPSHFSGATPRKPVSAPLNKTIATPTTQPAASPATQPVHGAIHRPTAAPRNSLRRSRQLRSATQLFRCRIIIERSPKIKVSTTQPAPAR